ncbi:hypothetical protein E2320_015884, partial [Naja naja]
MDSQNLLRFIPLCPLNIILMLYVPMYGTTPAELSKSIKCEESDDFVDMKATTSRSMSGPPTLALLCLTLALLLSPPAGAWYKQAAGPSYYSVGRASGLLSGIRRSPYMRRSDDNGVADGSAEGGPAASSLAMPESRQNLGGLRNL